MAENTKIEWTDCTFNPWWGCQKVSPACDHCYAERDAKRFAPGRMLWGVDSERRIFADKPNGKNDHWEAPLKWAKTLPAKLGRRPRVFCASMADWLDLDAPIGEFIRLLRLIEQTPELDWLLLTKRIGNWRKRMQEAVDRVDASMSFVPRWAEDWLNGKPPANVWIGSTVVNQEEADRDVPKLLQVPARVRFLSIEPMLGPIDIRFAFSDAGVIRCPRCMFGTNRLDHGPCPNDGETLRNDPGVHWIICGGESGHGARPLHPDWARSLRDQCKAADVPFLFKQNGEFLPVEISEDEFYEPQRDHEGELIAGANQQFTVIPNAARIVVMRRVGKKAAGRHLDGVTHTEFPEIS